MEVFKCPSVYEQLLLKAEIYWPNHHQVQFVFVTVNVWSRKIAKLKAR